MTSPSGSSPAEATSRHRQPYAPRLPPEHPDLNRLLHAVIEREERISLAQLAEVVPDEPDDHAPSDLLARCGALPRRRDEPPGDLANHPAAMPLEGTPPIVRQHVEAGRADVLARIERLVRWAVERDELPRTLDVELTARAIRGWSEQAGRMLLTDSERYPPERYGRFAQQFLDLLAAS